MWPACWWLHFESSCSCLLYEIKLRTLAAYCTIKIRMILNRASFSDSYLFILLIWPLRLFYIKTTFFWSLSLICSQKGSKNWIKISFENVKIRQFILIFFFWVFAWVTRFTFQGRRLCCGIPSQAIFKFDRIFRVFQLLQLWFSFPFGWPLAISVLSP